MDLADYRKLQEVYEHLGEAKKRLEAVLEKRQVVEDRETLEDMLDKIEGAQAVLA